MSFAGFVRIICTLSFTVTLFSHPADPMQLGIEELPHRGVSMAMEIQMIEKQTQKCVGSLYSPSSFTWKEIVFYRETTQVTKEVHGAYISRNMVLLQGKMWTCTDTDSRWHAPFSPKWSYNKTALPDAKQTLFYVSNLLLMCWAFPLFGASYSLKQAVCCGLLEYCRTYHAAPKWHGTSLAAGYSIATKELSLLHLTCSIYSLGLSNLVPLRSFLLQLLRAREAPRCQRAWAPSSSWMMSFVTCPSCLPLKFQPGTSACQPASFCHT